MELELKRQVADEEIGITTTRAVGSLEEEWELRSRALFGFDFVSRGTIPVRLYFVLDKPRQSKPIESFYHIACTQEAEANPRDVSAAVYRHFQSMSVSNARSQKLYFWDDKCPADAPRDYLDRKAKDLILLQSGPAFAWADLLRECLRIHGIQTDMVEIKPNLESPLFPKLPTLLIPGEAGRPPETVDVKPTVGLLIAPMSWPRRKQGSVDRKKPDEETDIVDGGGFTFKLEQNPKTNDAVAWKTPEVLDGNTNEPTRIAQGRKAGTAYGQFQTHYIIFRERINGPVFATRRYYEPSYLLAGADSKGFDNLDAWEEAALATNSRQESGGFFCAVGLRPTPQPGKPNPLYLRLYGAARDPKKQKTREPLIVADPEQD